MNIQAMAEVLLYGALLLGICTLLGTRAIDPIEEEEIQELLRRYRRQKQKSKTTRYYE